MHSILAAIRVILHLSHRTAGGVEVIGAVWPIDVQQAIEKGISETIQRAFCAGYTKRMKLKDYSVHLRAGVITPEGNTAFLVPAGAYKGTEWDRGDGMMYETGFADAPWSVMTLAYIEGDLKGLTLAAQNEAEHIVTHPNDRKLFNATAVHQEGAGHPLLKAC